MGKRGRTSVDAGSVLFTLPDDATLGCPECKASREVVSGQTGFQCDECGTGTALVRCQGKRCSKYIPLTVGKVKRQCGGCRTKIVVDWDALGEQGLLPDHSPRKAKEIESPLTAELSPNMADNVDPRVVEARKRLYNPKTYGRFLESLSWSGVTCLGGHPTYSGRSSGSLSMDTQGVHFSVFKERIQIPWREVAELVVEGPDQAQGRITATRMLTLGVFALAAKKQQKLSYLTVITTSGDNVMFEIESAMPQEVRGKTALIASALWVIAEQSSIHEESESPAGEVLATSPDAPVPDIKGRLANLTELLDSGVISDTEYEVQRGRILSGI
jgi:hypothetical protein